MKPQVLVRHVKTLTFALIALMALGVVGASSGGQAA